MDAMVGGVSCGRLVVSRCLKKTDGVCSGVGDQKKCGKNRVGFSCLSMVGEGDCWCVNEYHRMFVGVAKRVCSRIAGSFWTIVKPLQSH